MTKEILKEELKKVADMTRDPRSNLTACVKQLHEVLEQIPQWKDVSVVPPSDSILDIYDHYDTILIESLADQYFIIMAGDDPHRMLRYSLPYSVAEIGMKSYLNDVNSVPLSGQEEPEPPSKKVKLGFKKLDPGAQLPKYAHEGDAGMDVFALEDSYLEYGTPRIVRTGIAAEIPDGYELQVRARSGLAVKGVEVVNGPGTVDSKYRGEIGVILRFINYEDDRTVDVHGTTIAIGRIPCRGYEIKKGDKIAQIVLAPVTFADPYEVEELSETDRGTGGFGSTGR